MVDGIGSSAVDGIDSNPLRKMSETTEIKHENRGGA
jgi:hypothetical protein